MTTRKNILLLFIFLAQLLSASEITLSNARYVVVYNSSDHSIIVRERVSGKAQIFTPTYQVAYSSSKPSMSLMDIKSTAENITFRVCGFGSSYSLFDAKATFSTLEPTSATISSDSTIEFTYPAQDKYTLTATLTCPSGNEDIKLTSHLVNKATGFFSVGYYGANEMNISEVTELFQPHVFTGLRAPNDSYLTPAFMATIPGTFVEIGQLTYGVYADADELPFDPLPVTLKRSPFGVALRNKQGVGKELKPMIWAPIMSNTGSQLSSVNKSLTFSVRLYVSSRTLRSAYEDISCRVFGFGDYRHNDLGTLNETLDRLVDYAMSTEWDVWKADMKGSSYETDVPGSVKNVSAMPAWIASLIRDDETIFEERAEPLTEFLLSRKNSNFSPVPTDGAGGQTATADLGAPCMNTSEMLTMYTMFGKRMGAMMYFADHSKGSCIGSHENNLRRSFSYYMATGSETYRQYMTEGADKYIAEEITRQPTSFDWINNSNSSFWCQLAPKFVEIYEVFRLTGDSTYLYAAREGARMYALHLWMIPRVVQGDSVLCNIGNKAPLYRSGTAISLPEEYAPTWRLSEQGMQSECSQTSYGGHRGVFTANYAPLMLRIGAQTRDTFLMNIGKANVIGRYRNFPGYHINTDRTTVYEKADFPLRPFSILNSCTSVHHNHLWPQIGMLIDYLVSDVAVRTNGQVDFPGYYVQNIVHMANRAYYTDGTYYGEKGLTLYMPKDFLKTTNQELNYIAAHGNNKLYLVFTNQCKQEVNSTIIIGGGLNLNGKSYSVRRDNNPSDGGSITNNSFPITVSASGVTAVAIEDVQIKTQWQHRFESNTNANNWNRYVMDTIAMADSKAILLNPSDSVVRLFVYSQDASLTEPYTVKYSLDGGKWQEKTDNIFPYECTIAVDEANRIDFIICVGEQHSDTLYFERKRPKAILKGWNTTTLKQGTCLTIDVDGGVPPFNGELNQDGTMNLSFSDSTNPIKTIQYPQLDTRYSLTSLIDSHSAQAICEGDAKVVVIDAYKVVQSFPVTADSYVFSSQKNINYGMATNLDMKGISSSRKDIYIRAKMPPVALSENQSLRLGLYLTETSRLSDDGVVMRSVVDVGSMEWEDNTITYANQPAITKCVFSDTVAFSNVTPTGCYVYWDITPLTQIYNVGDNIDMHLRWLDGAETANMSFASNEEGVHKPSLMILEPISTDLHEIEQQWEAEGSGYDILGRPTTDRTTGIIILKVKTRDGEYKYYKTFKP